MSKDSRSITGLVNQHFEFVWRALRRFGLEAADADDAAQQVFMVLARRFSEIEPGRERAFLFGTAVRVASRVHRSERRRRQADGVAVEEIVCPEPGLEAGLDQRRAAALLDQVLDGMGDDVREVFVLHELEQFTMAEIAETLEIPAGTAASRLRRAREQFNQGLARQQAMAKHRVAVQYAAAAKHSVGQKAGDKA